MGAAQKVMIVVGLACLVAAIVSAVAGFEAGIYFGALGVFGAIGVAVSFRGSTTKL